MKIKSDSGGCEYCDTSCEWWGMCPHTTPYEALEFTYGEVNNDELRSLCKDASRDEQKEVIAKYYLKKRRKRK